MDVWLCLYCKQPVCMLYISRWKFGFHIAVQVSIERSAYELDFQNANNICIYIFIYKKPLWIQSLQITHCIRQVSFKKTSSADCLQCTTAHLQIWVQKGCRILNSTTIDKKCYILTGQGTHYSSKIPVAPRENTTD